MAACPSCAATLAPDATWCGLCHRSLLVEEAASSHPGWRPPESQVAWLVPTYSRRARSATTFGLTGRIVATVLVILPLVWTVAVGAVVAAAMWLVVVLPWSLRDIWRAVRTDQI